MLKLISMMKRRPGMSQDEFKQYYENRHVPFVRSIAPHYAKTCRNFVLPATRSLLDHLESAPPNPPFDVITEVWFEDASQYERFVAACADPEIAAQISEDEEKLFDRNAGYVFLVDECVSDYYGSAH